MATDPAGRTAKSRRARGVRSVTFYAWLGIGVLLLFLIAAIVFVMVGASYQSSAAAASTRAQRLQLINASAQRDFVGARRSLRGYLATGRDQLLQTYHLQRLDCVDALRRARLLAEPDLLPGVNREAGTAAVAFRLEDAAAAAPRGGQRARALSGLAGAASDRFLAVSAQVQARLTADSAALADASQRALGLGLPATAAVLIVGGMIPLTFAFVMVRRVVLPVHRATEAVLRLAEGGQDTRVTPSGPAEIRRLGESINYLAGEIGRMRAELEERAQLAALVRDIGSRVREYLDPERVVREVVATLQDSLRSDYVWVGLITEDGEMTLPAGNQPDRGIRASVLSSAPSFYVEWMRGLYADHASYWMQDLASPEAEEIPAEVRQALARFGAVSLLVTPFGAGARMLGEITLVRTRPLRPWTAAEISTVEAIASDIGRGLDHAMLYSQQKELVERLTAVDRAKTNFLASITHDLRSPLTGILGNTEMLGEDPENPISPAQRRMLEAIDRNASRLQSLIEDLLAMSRIELGSFETSLRPIDLAGVVHGAVEEVRVTAAEKGVSLTVSCPDHGLPVNGDAGQLDRALTNVLTNAVKYTPRGGSVTVTAGREDAQVTVAVADTGIGIPERDQPSLFTRFFRASNAVTRDIPGTGLGLAIVRAIVDNHRGDVALRSREGMGTTVTIRLPAGADRAATGGDGRDASRPSPPGRMSRS